MLGDVGNIDPLAGMLANETAPAGDLAVVCGQYLSRQATGHTFGRDEFQSRVSGNTSHHFVQDFRSSISDPLSIGPDAGEWRIAERTDRIVVIHADNADTARNINSSESTHVQNLLAADVIADEQSSGGRSV